MSFYWSNCSNLVQFPLCFLFYIDHVNTNSILYSVMKDDFMSRYSKKSVPGSYLIKY